MHNPVRGGPADDGMMVVDVLSTKLERLIQFGGFRYLDVGCGNGAFTIRLGQGFDQVWGIDIEMTRLRLFDKKIRNGNLKNYHIAMMSAENMSFPDKYFNVLTAIEVLEHVSNLHGVLAEFSRVLKPKGYLGITCPNWLFPFETHGIWWRGRELKGRIPLLTYIPFLHRKYALANVFGVSELDSILKIYGFYRTGLDFAFPTFERGSRLGKIMKPFRSVMNLLENSPLKCLGVSIIASYQKS
jgi:2-polyprenyl-3-methyl-5-hydroxy-6-metoxy-1,4-benzoquinol methylase